VRAVKKTLSWGCSNFFLFRQFPTHVLFFLLRASITL